MWIPARRKGFEIEMVIIWIETVIEKFLRVLKLGFKQSEMDLCLFIHDHVNCLTYVDDCLFFSPAEKYIDDIIARLQDKDMKLSVEDDVAGFLGVHINCREDGTIELLQTGLIDQIISAMGLEGTNPKSTPAEYGSLPVDKEGKPCNESFNYASVIGMLMYLQGHSRLDIGYMVHACACGYTHNPKQSHELALKHIGKYLIGTRK